MIQTWPPSFDVLVARARLADHADAAAGAQLDVDHDDVVGNRVELLDGLGFRGREPGDLEGGVLREHVLEPAAQQRRILDQQDAQRFAGRAVLAGRVRRRRDCVRLGSGWGGRLRAA